MSSQAHKTAKKRRAEEEEEEGGPGSTSQPTPKRKTTTNSTDGQSAMVPSIFGNGEKTEGQMNSGAEKQDMEPTTSGLGPTSGDPSLATMALAVPSGSLEGATEVEARPVDRLFSERVVTVHVGWPQTTWRIHENLLSASSDFFKAAFHSGFRETIEDQLSLPADDPQAFELFVRWLYGRALTPAGGNDNTAAVAAAAAALSSPPPPIQTWLRLYALACKLMIEELENLCVDAAGRYYSVGTRRPDIKDVQYIYETTPADCGMREMLKERLTLGLFRGRQHNPVTEEWREALNDTPDLAFEILSEISGFHWVSGGNVPARTGSAQCAFHRHENGGRCRP